MSIRRVVREADAVVRRTDARRSGLRCRPALLGPAILATVLAVRIAAAAPADSALIEAARSGDAATVRALVAKRADVNAAAVDGSTALHWAVHRDDADMVETLIRAGANVSQENRYGVRPLFLAAQNGNGRIVSLLLRAGADPKATMTGGETMVMTAARSGNPGALTPLIEAGADVNARDERGQTALMWAAARNSAAAVKTLVELGADLKIRTNNPAAGGGRNSVFNSPAPTGFTALLFAVRAGSVDGVRALLDAGADVNDTLSDGQSALVVATANAHWDVASLLLDRGADPNAAGAGWNALHQTIHSRRPNLGYTPGPVPTGSTDSIQVIKKLIARGIDVDARMTRNGMKDGQRNRHNRLGATAFLLAAKRVDVEAMKVLVAAGADAKVPAADGTTPLMVAAGLMMWYVGEDGGSMAGHEHEAVEAVKMCVELGNDVNARNIYGETPLHGAAFRGVNEIVDYLVGKGAILDARDSRGWTPFTIANGISYGDVFKQQPQTAKLLEQLMTARGLSTAGQAADGTECLDCVQTHSDQARAALERDRRMEAEFAKAEAERLAAGRP
jgi:ankyrin repeat protein